MDFLLASAIKSASSLCDSPMSGTWPAALIAFTELVRARARAKVLKTKRLPGVFNRRVCMQIQWGRRVGILRLPRWRGHSARGLRGRPIPVEAPAQQASSRRALQGAPPCAHWQPWPRLGRARARESTQAPDTSLPVVGAFCRLQSRLRPWADSELGLGCDGAALTPRRSRNWPWLRRTSKARSSHVRVCAASGSPSAFTIYTLLDAGELRVFKLQGIDMPAESVRNSFSPIATH